MGRGERDVAPVAQLCGATTLVRECLPRRAASVGAVRLLVEDVLVARGVTQRGLVDAVVLLASELATDGVRHGTGDALVVEVGLGDEVVQLTVTVPVLRRPGQSAPPVAEHSQQVLDMMAAGWEVRVASGTRTGWCRLDRAAAAAVAPAARPAEPDPPAGVPAARPPRGRAHPVPRSGGRPALRRIK